MEVGQRVKISGTNSIWDGKEGVVESIDGDDTLVKVDFDKENNRFVKQNFSITNLEEAYKYLGQDGKLSNGDIGDITKDHGEGIVTFKNQYGISDEVFIDDLEEIPEEEESIIDLTMSFKKDIDELRKINPNELEFLFDNNSGFDKLEAVGIDNLQILINRCIKIETISNNQRISKYGITVYSLFKGVGSSNQTRAYFYRRNDTLVFVRCVFKKTPKNSPQEEKAILDTIRHAQENKLVDNGIK